MKRVFFLTIVIASSFLITHASLKKTFIGYRSCIKCHQSKSLGNQYDAWKKTPHYKAYKTLYSAEARKIAKQHKITEPYNDLRCLKCHTTGKGKYAQTKREGVGCEACHGPGSLYQTFNNHASFDNREIAYRKAIRNGMYPILEDNEIKNRSRVCYSCHDNKQRLCADKSKQQENLSINTIADFVYKHPVRK